MTAYKIKYQTRRQGGVSVHQGDWQDKECIVVAEEDALEAIHEVKNKLHGYDFRLNGVEVMGQVAAIASGLIVKISPVDRESQNTTGQSTKGS